MTSCTSVPATPAASRAPRAAAAPSCGAVTGARTPWKAPMGVRWAATMTTEESDMMNSSGLGSGSGAWPRHPKTASVARTQALFENRHETFADLLRAETLPLLKPVGDPVERAGQGERRHFHIAGLHGAIANSLAQQAADALIDLGLERTHLAAHGGVQVLHFGAHHAPAE